MATPLKKTFARFTDWRFSPFDSGVEIKSEADAVAKALENRALCFDTYDVYSLEVNGRVLEGKPENRSARRYVGIEKIYSKQDVLEDIDRRIADIPNEKDPQMRQALPRIYRQLKDVFNRVSNDAGFIAVERPGEFTQLKENEKVFDRKGQQIWPKA